MEHDEKPLPIDTRLLGALAEKVSCIVTLCVLWQTIEISMSTCVLLKLLNYIFSVSSICKSPPL